ncbi:MAG: hypothetical protein JWM68_20 [Verrucomicrobiales bacterium]|nr:hypothetical protein [Verrucomicrobiales bacterium]
MRLLVVVFVSSSAALLAILSSNAAELSPQQTKDARKIYLVKCAKCHELYDPKAYSNAEWDKWMVKMKKKSKLKDEPFELVKEYTATLRGNSASVQK